MSNMIDHYQAVLRDLEQRRNRCQKELEQIDQTITGMRKLLATSASLFAATPMPSASDLIEAIPPYPSRKYAGISVRWALLKLMAEEETQPLKVTDMAERLVDGGVTSKGKDFAGNVAAVVSNMVKERKELEPAEGNTYKLSIGGKLAWASIKNSPKYINRDRGQASSAILQ